jgi:hypothetical protein
MARFWLNLDWDDCHFVHFLLRTNRHFGGGCKTKKIPEEKHWYPTACMQAATTTMSELCVLGYLLYIVLSLLLLQTYNWLGTCHFSWCCNNYACNAMQCQYRVEHWPLLITVYPQLIFSKSCRNNNIFFPFWEKKEKKEKTREKKKILTILIWIFQNFNNNSH